MILIPQSILRDCNAVFRRAVPKSSAARSATVVQVLGGRDGVRLRLMNNIAIEYHYSSPSDSGSFTIPMTALGECSGRGDGTVQFQPSRNGKVEVVWEQSGVPNRREFSSQEALRPFPSWPGRDAVNESSFVLAMDNAMQIPAGGASGHLALNCIQMRGRQGDIVATNGRQLLIQGGFKFPWEDAVLVPRTPIFAARELRTDETVRVAQNKTHVFFRIGAWTLALQVEISTRFPDIDQVIPKANLATTRWHVGADEATALAAMLDQLPAAKEEHAPITLDLNRSIVIRVRAGDQQRCTDLVLPRSSMDGKSVRVVMDRRFLQRALELGFRSIQITAPDKPILCQDGNRTFVWVLLDPTNALKPQPGAVRIMLPTAADGNIVAVSKSHRSPAPSVRDSAGPRNRVHSVDGFLNCAQTLWDMVRKHHAEERVK